MLAVTGVLSVGALPFNKKKDDEPASLLKNFDMNEQFAQMLSNPEMVAEMQQMMKDPATMDEVRKLVADPEFKKKIETFQNSENFEGAKQMFGQLMSDPNAAQKMNAAKTVRRAGARARGCTRGCRARARAAPPTDD